MIGRRWPADRLRAQEMQAQLVASLADQARRYSLWWSNNPGVFRRCLQRELRRNIQEMREQRQARIERRDAMLDWLGRYETWREQHGRPISYVRQEARAA